MEIVYTIYIVTLTGLFCYIFSDTACVLIFSQKSSLNNLPL